MSTTPNLAVPHSSRPDTDETCDVVVIGSGFGGAVAACRLAQAGFDVLVLERGRRYGPRDFPALPAGGSLLPDFRRWVWKSDQGLWDVLDLQEIISVQAAGYGGGSLIYANVHLRPPPAVFDRSWPDEYKKGTCLEPFYDLAAHMLEVAPLDKANGLGRIPKADQLVKAVTELGREGAAFQPPLAIAYSARTNLHGVKQKACTSCGACSSGCPETAKNTLDLTYLATAEKHGARAITECEVLDLDAREDGWAVVCDDHVSGRRRTFRAKSVFVCAGSVHSTRLLARARARRPEGPLARSPIGVGYWPGGDALAVAYDTKHPQYPSIGPTITTTVVHWSSESSFFMIQDGGYAKQLERLIGVLRALPG